MKQKFRKSVCLVIIAGCMAWSCRKDAPPAEDANPSVQPVVEVEVAPMKIGRMEQMLRVTGKTQVLHQEHLNAPIAGKIIELNVAEGSVVAAGQQIAVIRTRESQAIVDGANAEVAKATTDEQKTSASAALKLAEQHANNLVVRARFDGVIATRSANAGEFIAENTELVSVLDLASLYFLANVPVSALGQIKIGDASRITFAGMPHSAFSAKIDNINPQIDAASQMAKVRMKFEGAIGALRGEMFGEASINIGVHTSALIVPASAVMMNNETGVASIAIAVDSMAHVVAVKTGISDTGFVEIVSPVFESGTPVIVKGNHGLRDSTRVTIVNAPK